MVSLIVDEKHDPRHNLAVDEALARSPRTVAAFRLWRNSACVVVGRSQRVEREVNLAACARDRTPVLRRASGGGTVYTDPGTINVSVVAPGPDIALPRLLEILVDALGRLGAPATRRDRGLFVAAGDSGCAGSEVKVSGFAELRTATACLAHATVLVQTPSRRVESYLAPAPAERHPLDSHRCRVLSLRELGLDAHMTGVRAALVAAGRRHLGPLNPRRLSTTEHAWLEDLLAARYCDPAWHLTADSQRRQAWTVRDASSSTARWC